MAEDFCHVHRPRLHLQDLVDIGIPLAIEALGRGRPDVQTSSRINKDDSEEDFETDVDRSISSSTSLSGGRPLEILREEIGSESWESWIKPLRVVSCENGVAAIEAPYEAVQDFVSRCYGPQVCAALGVESLKWVTVPPVREIQSRPLLKAEDTSAKGQSKRLLALYATVTGNRVRPEDEAAFREIERLQAYQVLAAIYKAQALVAGGKINSFNFVVKVVKEIALSGEGPQLVEYWRERLYGRPRQAALPRAEGDLIDFRGKS